MSKDMFLRSILPIGLLFSASLILSNTAYLYLSVAYIQMLKVRIRARVFSLSELKTCHRRSYLSLYCSSPGRSGSTSPANVLR